MPLPRLLARVVESLLARLPSDDPWERLTMKVRPRDFGQGSQHDFRWYFEGESRVQVASLAEVCVASAATSVETATSAEPKTTSCHVRPSATFS